MKIFSLIAALLLCATSARADEPEPKNEFSLVIGNVMSRTKITLDGSDYLASAGVAAGVRLLTRVSPRLMVGAEIQSLKPSERRSGVLITRGDATTSFESLLILGELKWIASGKRRFRPYALGGLGVHSTSMKIDVEPQRGYVWADTGTTEIRRQVDSRRSAAALTLQAGADFPVNERVVLGFGASWYYLGKTTYHSTAKAKATRPAFTGVDGSLSALSILAHMGFRF